MRSITSVKIIGSLVILTALIIALSVFSQNMLYNDSVSIGNAIEEIRNCARAGEWDKAISLLDQVVTEWERKKVIWSSLIDHQEIDNIDSSLSRLKPLLETRDASSALSEASVLHNYIQHIPEREKLSIDNLL